MAITATDIMQMVARIIVICIAFPIHECAHAFIANKLGDPTAKNLGRISLNPFTHMKVLPAMAMIVLATLMDVFTKNYTSGNLILLITSVFFFRPVPINPRYFKNRKAGMALTGIAGPMSNILLGFVFLVAAKLLTYFAPGNTFVVLLYTMFNLIISINLQLAAFNLLPIPPMDGYRVLELALSDRVTYMLEQYSRYIMLGMIALLYLTPVLDYFIMAVYKALYIVIDFLSGFVDLLAGAI